MRKSEATLKIDNFKKRQFKAAYPLAMLALLIAIVVLTSIYAVKTIRFQIEKI